DKHRADVAQAAPHLQRLRYILCLLRFVIEGDKFQAWCYGLRIVGYALAGTPSELRHPQQFGAVVVLDYDLPVVEQRILEEKCAVIVPTVHAGSGRAAAVARRVNPPFGVDANRI